MPESFDRSPDSNPLGAEEPFHIRPRFRDQISWTVEEASRRLKSALEQPDASCQGKVRMGYVSLFPLTTDRHYWSPYLSCTIEEDEEESTGETIIRGVYGPSPEAWTLFVFLYTVIGLAFVIVVVIGFANRSIGESSAILWFAPVLLALFLSLYAVAYLGQKRGKHQMQTLHRFLEKTLEQSIGRGQL